ncbi:MAG: hypothetical protein ACTSPD_09925 [Promethearchaeota archaeon]
MKINIRLIAINNAYGFGKDWQLEVNKGKKRKVFWLGQDCKVCSRLLRLGIGELAEHIKTKFNTDCVLFDRKDINNYLSRLILGTMYDLESEELESQETLKQIAYDIFDRPAWEMSVQ